ncbi:glycine-rich domain-containing protein [Lysinibacillus fusiformis]|uniref:Glycine-rich domain-containing protein n=1 Tax=Lysinibacillus fusiformis TaxID=28031 RepID=A0A1E4R9W9_9BACI|nr:hypothetical protein [Lysinibacillus fusiformis]ODV57267.1 hypothetical protein BG258_15795 [Lysinibacillus fusiformis]
MIKFGMFNSINGDRRYKAEDFAQYFATFIGNGIFVKPSDCLQVMAVTNAMKVIIRPGKAWINGFYLINDEDYNLSIAVGDSTLNRIDRIVIRLDFVQRKMSVEVKKGALSASPVAPTLKRDADAYELALADVYVAKGAITVSQAVITDTRLNNNLCGYMHNPIYQVDTTTIFNQYQQWFNDYSVTKAAEFLTWQTEVTTALENWIDAQEQDFVAWRQAEEQLYYTWLEGRKNHFDDWFAQIKANLDENAAGNLQNQINDHKDASRPHKYFDSEANTVYTYGLQRNPSLKTASFVYGLPSSTEANIINLSTYEQSEELILRVGALNSPPSDVPSSNINAKINKLLDDSKTQDTLIRAQKVAYEHQVFHQSGNFTVPTGVKTVYVTMMGGGGGGGGASISNYGHGGGGGGTGCVAYRMPVRVDDATVIPVTVGLGGVGGTGGTVSGNQNGTTGGAGGASAFRGLSVGGGNGGDGGTAGNLGIDSKGGLASQYGAWLGRLAKPQYTNTFGPFTFLYGNNGGTVKGSTGSGNGTGAQGGTFYLTGVTNEAYKFASWTALFGSWDRGNGGAGGSVNIAVGGQAGQGGATGNPGFVIIEWGEMIWS